MFKEVSRVDLLQTRGDPVDWINMARNAFKLVLVGSGGVGKSCLTIQYISKKFVEDYDPTLEDSYRKPITLESGEPAVLDIFDTAGMICQQSTLWHNWHSIGQEDFQAVRDSYIRTGDGFLCVYSVTLQSSFDEAVHLYSHINNVKDVEECPFVLIGNKCDLEDARQVTFEKGQSLATDLSCPFLEASAKTRYNVDEAFATLVKEIQKAEAGGNSNDPNVPVQPAKARERRGCSLF